MGATTRIKIDRYHRGAFLLCGGENCLEATLDDSNNWVLFINESNGNGWSVDEVNNKLIYSDAGGNDGGFLYKPIGYKVGKGDITMRIVHPGETDAWTGVALRTTDPNAGGARVAFVAYYRFRSSLTDRWEFVKIENIGQSLAGFTPSTISTGLDRDPKSPLYIRVQWEGEHDDGTGVIVRVKDWTGTLQDEPQTWRGESISTNPEIPDAGGAGAYQALTSGANTEVDYFKFCF